MLQGNKVSKLIWENNTIWSVISVLLNVAINFTIVPFVANTIGIEAYGFVTLSNTIITYIDIVSIAINAFACRFIAIAYHNNDMERANSYFTSCFFANIALIIVVAILGIVAIPNLDILITISPNLDTDVKILFCIVTIRYFFVLIRTVFDVSTFVTNRLDITEKARAGSYIIQSIVLLIWVSVVKEHVWYIGLSTTLAALFMLVIQLVYTKKATPNLIIRRRFFSIKRVVKLIEAGIWNSINNLGNLLNSGLDLLIANKLLTEVIVGIISVSKTLGSLCYTLVTAVSISLRPKQLESYSKDNIEELIYRLKYSMCLTGSLSAIMLGGFIACGRDFLALWLPNENIELIYRLSVIVLIGDISIGVVNPLYYVFTLTKKMKIPCYITILMGLINVISMYLLIKKTNYGEYAVVLTTMILNMLHFIDAPLYSSYCLNIPYRTFYPTIIKHCFNTVVTGTVLLCIRRTAFYIVDSWTSLLLEIMILGIIAVCISLIIGIPNRYKLDLLKEIKKRIE